jgi:hypothetical protein
MKVTYTILVQKTDLKIALIPIDDLKPHEKGSPLYLKLLKQELLKDGVLKYPIIADEKTKVILDGMHRWLALKSLGCMLIPTILVDAARNNGIRIGRRRIHRYVSDPTAQISEEEVLSAGLAGRLMKPRSTRHFFPFSKLQRIDCPLSSLGKHSPQDVSRYLAGMSGTDCKLAIEDWLREISEELDFLNRRKEEVEREMEEFLNRVRKLDNGFSIF